MPEVGLLRPKEKPRRGRYASQIWPRQTGPRSGQGAALSPKSAAQPCVLGCFGMLWLCSACFRGPSVGSPRNQANQQEWSHGGQF